MKKKYLLQQLAVVTFMVCIASILTACSHRSSGDNTQVEKTISMVPSSPSVTLTPTSMTISVTASPSAIPTQTATSSPLPTMTLTPTPTPELTRTPLPTLLPEAAEKLVKDLLVNNGGCILPCWWGIMPGVTVWNDANQFLATFTTVEGPVNFTINGIRELGYQVSYQLNTQVSDIGFGISDGVVDDIAMDSESTIWGHTLPQLLENNGQPEEVYLYLMPDSPDGSWFFLLINYPEQGILARYTGQATRWAEFGSGGEVVPIKYSICPIGIGPELWLRPPGTPIQIKGNPALGGTDFTRYLKALPDVTKMSLEEFYSTFRGADATTCFDTPADAWP
jgi:hypothetical protein